MELIYKKLQGMLNEKRFKHSVGVQKTAVELAEKYGCDVGKASMAGLIHDCAKNFTDEELLEYAVKNGIEINDVYKKQPQLLHGPVGAIVARNEFSIDDEEILHAIAVHTTGCKNMSVLDKIIYIADYVEPGRVFPGVEDLRKSVSLDLDRGVLLALDSTIKHIIDMGQLIDMNTIYARNYMITYMMV